VYVGLGSKRMGTSNTENTLATAARLSLGYNETKYLTISRDIENLAHIEPSAPEQYLISTRVEAQMRWL
jgi:hypothetical protein